MTRKLNFYAGPATLPLSVIEQIRDEMVDYHGMGMSLIETSHRGKDYEKVHNDAVSLIKDLLGLPDNYKILFLGGGATLQFSMIPLNFLHAGKVADYTLSGAWAKKAFEDANKVGKTSVIYDGKPNKYTELPESITVNPDAAYVHLTSNETIHGCEWKKFPDTGKVPLICDMSSDMLSRPIPVDKFAFIYAGAQKNLGPAGVTLVIVRDDMLERCPSTLTAYLNYKTHAEENSLYNTPPVFGIYVVKLVMEWIKKSGGLVAMEEAAKKKAAYIYDAIDACKGFYNCPVKSAYRSVMNVVFTLPNEDLSAAFIKESQALGMVGLKGHRSLGGCRASIYNAFPMEGAATLANLMKDFAKRNG
jgi:phosphoserine aminotransferase